MDPYSSARSTTNTRHTQHVGTADSQGLDDMGTYLGNMRSQAEQHYTAQSIPAHIVDSIHGHLDEAENALSKAHELHHYKQDYVGASIKLLEAANHATTASRLFDAGDTEVDGAHVPGADSLTQTVQMGAALEAQSKYAESIDKGAY